MSSTPLVPKKITLFPMFTVSTSKAKRSTHTFRNEKYEQRLRCHAAQLEYDLLSSLRTLANTGHSVVSTTFVIKRGQKPTGDLKNSWTIIIIVPFKIIGLLIWHVCDFANRSELRNLTLSWLARNGFFQQLSATHVSGHWQTHCMVYDQNMNLIVGGACITSNKWNIVQIISKKDLASSLVKPSKKYGTARAPTISSDKAFIKLPGAMQQGAELGVLVIEQRL